MRKRDLRKMLDSLSVQEKETILLTSDHWSFHEELVEIKTGIYLCRDGEIEEIRSEIAYIKKRLSDAVAEDDKSGVIKDGIVELFRHMLIMQNESTCPQINAYFKRHLPEDLFNKWYNALGLSVDELAYDFEFADFPVDDLWDRHSG